jgi:hypothetical protein
MSSLTVDRLPCCLAGKSVPKITSGETAAVIPECPTGSENGLRGKIHFANRFKRIPPVQSCRGKYLAFAFSEMTISCRRPASCRGAYRDRHGRGVRDAVDATCRSTILVRTNGMARTAKSRGPDTPTLVSSWRRCFPHRADDGGQQARRTEESAYKPLKPSRREGRLFG